MFYDTFMSHNLTVNYRPLSILINTSNVCFHMAYYALLITLLNYHHGHGEFPPWAPLAASKTTMGFPIFLLFLINHTRFKKIFKVVYAVQKCVAFGRDNISLTISRYFTKNSDFAPKLALFRVFGYESSFPDLFLMLL